MKHVSKTLFDIEQILNLSEEEELWIEKDSKMKKAIDVTKGIMKKVEFKSKGSYNQSSDMGCFTGSRNSCVS